MTGRSPEAAEAAPQAGEEHAQSLEAAGAAGSPEAAAEASQSSGAGEGSQSPSQGRQ